MPLSGLPSSVGDRTGKTVQFPFFTGWNYNGIFGNTTGFNIANSPTESSSTIPIQIDTGTTWSKISCGSGFTAAIKSDGSLWMWGIGNLGQLGDGSYNSYSVPTRLGTATWTDVSCGESHVLAIKSDGTLWGWGYNGNSQVGVDSGGPPYVQIYGTPQQVSSASWTSVSAGYASSFAIKSDGTLWAWGANNNGQLGIGNTNDQSVPVQVGSSTWTVISGGGLNAHGIKTGGTLWGWGYGPNVGDGASVDKLSPVQIGSSTWTTVSGGYGYAHAIKSDGTLWAWGLNNPPVFGNGGNSDSASPVQVGSASNWSYISKGALGAASIIYAIKSDGTLWSSGRNTYGELGDGTFDESGYVSQLSLGQIGFSTSWSKIARGSGFAVAIATDGTLWAWGNNSSKQYQNTRRVGSSTSFVQEITHQFTKISTGFAHAAGIKSDGTLWTWGDNNNNGQLGLSAQTVGAASPTQVESSKWKDVACGIEATAAIKSDGTLWTWGANNYGELGLGTLAIPIKTSPFQVGSDTNWASVFAGQGFMLALKTNGTLWSWGRNDSGQLGLGAGNFYAPTQVGSSTWTTIGLGAVSNHVLAIKSDGSLWSWGQNGYGQLGNANPGVDEFAPILVDSGTWISVAAGWQTSFAIKSNGTMWAWGFNGSDVQTWGPLGLGNYTDQSLPTQIGSDTNWSSVYTGALHSFAFKTNGALYAWGQNASGQLGIGSITEKPVLTPTLVSLPSGNTAVSVIPVSTYIKDYNYYYGYYYDCSFSGCARVIPYFSTTAALIKYKK